jgi:hypothetical protein
VVHRPVGPLDAAPRPGRPLDARAAVDLPGTPLVEVAAEDLARCRDVVREFEAVRERYRGRLAAPISELADDRDRVVDAIVVVAGTSGLARRRELVADLVDLVTFVDPADAGLLEAYQRSASGGLALRESDLARAKRLLEALQVARATLAQQLRDDISVFGDLVALGEKPILIGDGRAALDAVRDYREGQLVGFLGAYVVIGGAAVAFLLDAAWFVALLAGWLGSVVGALAAVGIGGRVDRLLRSRTGIDSPFHRTIDTIRTGVVLVIGLGVPVGVMVAAVALT